MIWERVGEEKRAELGERYQELSFSTSNDPSQDHKAQNRLFEIIVKINAVKYIPEGGRAVIYRELAKRLARAKDTIYGWSFEESECKALAQMGPYVPHSALEEVYQEILSVWCGNYWGRSGGHIILRDFIFKLTHKEIVKIMKLFELNHRVREELVFARPKKYALDLLQETKDTMELITNKNEIDKIIAIVTRV